VQVKRHIKHTSKKPGFGIIASQFLPVSMPAKPEQTERKLSKKIHVKLLEEPQTDFSIVAYTPNYIMLLQA